MLNVLAPADTTLVMLVATALTSDALGTVL